MAQQENSPEEVLLKFFLKLRARLRAQIQRYIFQGQAFRLVDLLQTIHQRSALHGDTAIIFGDLCVGFEELRFHIELQTDDVAAADSVGATEISTAPSHG